MSKSHYPECWATYPSDPPAWCICDELRSCEQRVLKDTATRHLALMKMIGLGILQTRAEALRACEERVEESMDRAWNRTLQLAVAHTRTATLDAAREAVAALLAYESPMGPLIRTMAALAAIDALKEER